MKFTVIFILTFFCSFSLAWADPLSEEEAKKIIQENREKVEAARQHLKTLQNDFVRFKEELNNSRQALLTWSKELKVLNERLVAKENTFNASIQHIDNQLELYQKKLVRQRQAGALPEEIQETKRYIQAHINWKNTRLKKAPGAELRAKIKAKEAEAATLQKLFQANLERIKQTQKEIQKAQDKVLEADQYYYDQLDRIPKLLSHIAPPYLEQVEVKKGGSTIYKAEWRPYEEVVEVQIAAAQKGIDETLELIEGIKKLIGILGDDFEEAYKLADEKLERYVYYLKGYKGFSRASLKMILIDCADASINIARNAKTMGPYAFAYEAASQWTQTGLRKGGVTGPRNKSWDAVKLPAVPKSAEDHQALFDGVGTAIAVDQFKNLIKKGLETVAGSGREMVFSHNENYTINMSSLAGLKEFKNNFGKLMKEGKFWALMEGGNSNNARNQVMHNFDFFKEFYKTLKTNPKKIAKNLTSRFDRDMIKGLGIDVLQSAGIQMLKNKADEKRAKLWTDYLMARLYADDLQTRLTDFGNRHRNLRNQLEANKEVLEELLKEKHGESQHPTRYFKLLKDKTMKGESEFKIQLTFSGDIEIENVRLGDQDIEGSTSGKIWNASFTLDEMKGHPHAELFVDAKGVLSQKPLDNPSTTAKYNPFDMSWSDFDPETDSYHEIKMEELPKGRSFVFLFDCSSSMYSFSRMDIAKEQAHSIITNSISSADEIAILTFNQCGAINQTLEFTSNIAAVLKAISSLTGNGWSPISNSISESQIYLENNAKYDVRKLVVLSDQDETCGGNEYMVMSAASAYEKATRKSQK